MPVPGVLVLTRNGGRWQTPQVCAPVVRPDESLRKLNSKKPSRAAGVSTLSNGRVGGRRIGHVQDERGERVANVGVQETTFAFVVRGAIRDIAHRRGEAAVHQMAGAGFRLAEIAIGIHRLRHRGGVVAPEGVSGNAVPVVRLRVAQPAHRHGQPRRHLRAAGFQLTRAFAVAAAGTAVRGLEHPDELIGVAVRVAAFARERAGGGGVGVVEGDAALFHHPVGGVDQGDRAQNGRIVDGSQIHQGHRVVHGVQHPRLLRGAVGLHRQRDAARGPRQPPRAPRLRRTRHPR